MVEKLKAEEPLPYDSVELESGLDGEKGSELGVAAKEAETAA